MVRGGVSVLDDATPLAGPDIDPAVRMGWLVRTARLTARPDGGGSAPRLEDVARAIGSNPTRLHRLETGQLRDGRLVEGYERALGLKRGSLRAPIDIMCRTFPATSPTDRDPGPGEVTVSQLSRATERLLDPAHEPTGGEWLAWGRMMAQPGRVGLPDWLARELVERLVGELARSVGHAYPSRYEALALLRCTAYGAVVLDVARQVVGDPHVQVLNDLMSAVGEAVTPDGVAWCLRLLEDPRDRVVVAACIALENMGQITDDPGFWEPVLEPVHDLFEESEEGSTRWEWFSHLLRLVPAEARAARPVRTTTRPLAPLAEVKDWSRSRLNAHWADCHRRAVAIAARSGLGDEAMLARLLFDIAISPHETRAVTSYMLVGARPDLAELVAEQLADLVEHHPDPVVRARASRRLPGTLHGRFPPLAKGWLDSADVEERSRALMMAGAAGVEVDEAVLDGALRDGALLPALYAAGMTDHPVLARWAESEDPEVRGGVAWWRQRGSRIVS